MLADVWVEEIIKILVGVFVINVWTGVVIDTLSGVSAEVIIDVVDCDIGVEALTAVNANVVVAAMTALEFAMSAPCEEPISFC